MNLPPSSLPEDFDQTIKVRTPAAGAMYFNRYKLTRILGRGGMGVVWLADDLKLERPVALKFLPSLIGLDPSAVKELKTETRRGLELSHPNIVRIYDFVDDEDVAAISMEFVNARTLSELKAETKTGVFTAEQVARWLPGVCDALDYAHFQCKVVHRDLKPSNIMANLGDETAKIADFGIARSISDTMNRLSVSQLGVSGTLPYMSPQQAMGERPAPTDDVYSLGATIYELLSGKPPFFRGDIPSQITSKIPPSMIERREELEIKTEDSIPKEWEAVIAACLQKDPTLRPPSAGKLLELLGLKNSTTAFTKTFFQPAAATAPETAAPTTPPAASRNHLPVYAAAAVAVIAAAAAFYFKSSTPAPVAVANVAAGVEVPVPPAGAIAPLASPPAATPAAVTQEPAAAAAPPAVTPAPAVAATPAAVTPPAMVTPGSPAAPVPEPAAAATPPAVPPAPAVAATPVAVPPPVMVTPGGPAVPAAVTPAPAVVASVAPAAASLPVPGIPAPGGVPASQPLPATNAPVLQAVPPGAPSAALPSAAMVQPPVTDPPAGHWPLAMIFPTPPQAAYSENGRRRLLYQAQGVLKAAKLYTSTQDGKEGKGTHNAIILFQAKNGLVPNGLLDGPTLNAMALAALPDDPEWRAPAPAVSSPSRRKVYDYEDEQPNVLQRAGKSIGRLFMRE